MGADRAGRRQPPGRRGVAACGLRHEAGAVPTHRRPYALGSYTVTCTATGALGNTATAVRTMKVLDTTLPAIVLSPDPNGNINLTLECGIGTYDELCTVVTDVQLSPTRATASRRPSPLGVVRRGRAPVPWTTCAVIGMSAILAGRVGGSQSLVGGAKHWWTRGVTQTRRRFQRRTHTWRRAICSRRPQEQRPGAGVTAADGAAFKLMTDSWSCPTRTALRSLSARAHRQLEAR